YLPASKIPINTDKPFTLSIAGSAVVSGDYLLDSFLGKITITSANILALMTSATSATASYTLLKGFDAQWRYTVGNTPKQYIESDDPDYRAQYLPIIYNTLTVKTRSLGSADNFALLPTINYRISYLDNGSKFRIDFVSTNYNSSGVVTTRDWTDLKNTEIMASYKYAPGSFADAGDVAQRVMDMRVKLNLGTNFSLQGEVAHSEKQMNRGIADALDSILGSGNPADRYSLTRQNIVKDSDQVSIINANRQETLIGNDQYSLNYQAGYLRFRNGLVPQTSDTIKVKYKYYVNSQAQQQQFTDAGNALKVKAAGKTGSWNLAGYYSDIDQNFNPLGNIVQSKGTSEYGGTATYQPNKHLLFTSDLRKNIAHLKDADNKQYDSSSLYQRYTLSFKPLNTGQMLLSHEQSNAGDTAHATSSTFNAREVANNSYKQAMSYTFDLFNYPTLFEASRANASDSIAQTGSDASWLHLQNTYTPYAQFKLSSDFQESKSSAYRPSGIPNANLNNYGTNSISKINITYSPISQINTLTDYSYSRYLSQSDQTVSSNTVNLQEVKNWSFDYNYTPGWQDSAFSNLFTHGTLYHAESQLAYSGYTPDVDDRQGFDARINPWNLVGVNFSNQVNFYNYSNQKDLRSNRSSTLRFTGFNFFSLITMTDLNLNNRYSERDNMTDATISANYTLSEEKDLNYTLSSSPFSLLNINYYYQDKLNEDISSVQTFGLVKDSFISHPYQKQTWSLQSNTYYLGIPWTQISLGSLNGNTNLSLIKDITEETLASNNLTTSVNTRATIADSQSWAANYSVNLLPNLSLSDAYTRGQDFIYDTTSVSTANQNKDEYRMANNISGTWSQPFPLINITSISGATNYGETFRLEFNKPSSIFIYSKGNSAQLNYRPLDMITIQGDISKADEYSYQASSANFTRNSVQLVENAFDSRFNRSTLTGKGTVYFTPLSVLTLSSALELTDIEQYTYTPATSSIDSKLLSAQKLAAGLKYTPWSDLVFTYDQEWLNLWDHNTNTRGNGQHTVMKATYQPVAWAWERARGSVNFSWMREGNAGLGFNVLAQKYNSKDNFTLTQTEIESVDNFKETMDLSVDINVPMDSPVVQRLILTATAALINQVDRLKPELNNYNMFLLNIKGKIEF
ncbi:MAG: hypothetical protein WC838_03270, partial [Candidatus Margulisiibacteriota bacterium]